MSCRVHVVCPAVAENKPTWPHMNYDYAARAETIMKELTDRLPGMELSSGLYYDPASVLKAVERVKYDGYLVMGTAMQTGIIESEDILTGLRPLVLADDLYQGSGHFLTAHSLIREKNLPVVSLSTSSMDEIADAVRLAGVHCAMRNTTILVVSDKETWGYTEAKAAAIKQRFGTDVVRISSDDMIARFNRVDAIAAERQAARWTDGAVRVVEPDNATMLKSARFYLALKDAMAEHGADAVTVNCLGFVYEGKIDAYPCLSFFQLNNEGSTGVCESDLDSTVSQLLIRYVNGRPGYVSDPVIDTATDSIIYSHCVGASCMLGPGCGSNPYVIRSHAEDNRGAAVQSLMPAGYPLTTITVGLRAGKMAVHSAVSDGNIDDDRACRTKLVGRTDKVRHILDNWHFEWFGWHRVTCYGDIRRELCALARWYGLDIIHEDE